MPCEEIMRSSAEPPYRFDDVVVDPSNLRLTVGGAIRPVEPKSFRLLQFLIENRDRVVSKDEIFQAVWPDVTVTDNALTRAVAQVRKALDDDPKEPRYIETVPTVGYRFLALPATRHRPEQPFERAAHFGRGPGHLRSFFARREPGSLCFRPQRSV
jgi:DNA-binding winged helix-turn-helix (wHTH) protein